MAMIIIDGVALPSPSKYGLPDSDLDSENTNRNEEGVLQRDRIRQGLYKIELEWKAITSADLHTIRAAIVPEAVQVKHITETGYVTKTMYAGDRKVEMVKYNPDYNKIHWDISFNLTEY
ncbi:MAG TPA: hypothetical protein DC038_03645 [Clostridiales bacterium]|nr:hypothetical protein [Clostridiales bacterium]